MKCFLQFAAAFALLLPVWSAQPAKEPPKPAPKTGVKPAVPKIPAAAATKTATPGGVPKAGAARLPVLVHPPAAPVQRFLKLTPQEREIYIDKLPVPQQERFRKAGERFDALPSEERQRELKLYDLFAKLPKDTQDVLDQRFKEFSQLPPARRVAIRGAVGLINGKSTDAERQAIVDSQAFHDRFTPTEQQIITDFVKHYPNPDK